MRRTLPLLALPYVLVAFPALGAPVITEVAWMGSVTNATADEWVEIYNPGPDPIADLSQFVLVEGASTTALPAVSLAAGAVLVLEDNAGAATSLVSPQAEVFSLSLNNGGELLRLCPAATPNDLGTCDVANNGGGWAAGSNTTKATMVRKDAALDGALATSWLSHPGPDSAVTDSGVVAINGSPGEYAPVEEPDAGPPVEDAGTPAVDAGPLPPAPAITEVAWMGTEANANDEWLEIYNPGPDDIADLSAYVLVDGSGASALPAVALSAGSVLVLEDSALTTSLASPAAEIMSLGFTNSGEALRLCPLGSEAVLEECDIANVAGAWPGGDNDTGSKRTMVRIDADLDGSQPSSWMTHSGPASTVTDANATAILGTPGEYEPIDVDIPDGGVIVTDGGVIVQPDAGPNAEPTLSFVQVSRDGAGDVAIQYTAADPDGDDTVAVALFYDTDDDGSDGVRIAEGLPGGERTFSWKTTAVPPGSYHVFGVATDHRGAVSYAYAPGSVDVGEGQPGSEATLTLVDPDGVNDVVDGRITVRWEVALPEGEDGTVSLYYDVDEEGADGEPIIAGLPVYASDGEEGPRAYLWDPVDVPPGSYAVYAVLDWTGGSVVAYSQFVSVGGEGCACRSTGGSSAAWAAIFGLVVLLAPRARRRRQNGPTC